MKKTYELNGEISICTKKGECQQLDTASVQKERTWQCYKLIMPKSQI
jgi:hypothetical protein